MSNRLIERLEDPRPILLDGGLATELERHGHRLESRLWSAELLLSQPKAIGAVHHAYTAAGAEVATTATYQATPAGFRDVGLTDADFRAAVSSAVEQARLHLESAARPIVMGSIGPYGAYLANGAEYRGDYQLSALAFRRFHEERMTLLAELQVDGFACETIPRVDEAVALAELAERFKIPTWISFQCRDEGHLASGESIESAARRLAEFAHVYALGVNCVSPRLVAGVLRRLADVSSKHRLAYPNSGEHWDGVQRGWETTVVDASPWFADLASWIKYDIRFIGGCCRTTPEDIRYLAETLDRDRSSNSL